MASSSPSGPIFGGSPGAGSTNGPIFAGVGGKPSSKLPFFAAPQNFTSAPATDAIQGELKNLGAGGSKAAGALNRILSDPAIPNDQKQYATQIAGGTSTHKSGWQDVVSTIMKSPVGEAINALGMPERAAVGLVDQIGQLTGGEAKGATDTHGGFIQNLWAKAKDPNYGFQSLVDRSKTLTQLQHGADIGIRDAGNVALAPVRAVTPFDHAHVGLGFGKTATGIAGDTVFDPLTYVSGGATTLEKGASALSEGSKLADVLAAASKGAEAVSGASGAASDLSSAGSIGHHLFAPSVKLAKQDIARRFGDAASVAAKAGNADEAARLTALGNKVGEIGRGAASAKDLADVGVRAGIDLKLPFARLQLVGHDTLAPVEKVLGSARDAALSTKVGALLESHVGNTGERMAAARAGKTDFLSAIKAGDAARHGGLETVMGDITNGANRQAAIDARKAAGVTADELHIALDGGPTSDAWKQVAAKADKAGVANPAELGKTLYETAKSQYNAASPLKDMTGVADYAPRMLNGPEAVKAMSNFTKLPENQIIGTGRTSFEHSRVLTEDGHFLGESLADPKWGGTMIERINAIASAKGLGGMDVKQLFSTNFDKVSGTYLKMMHFRTQKLATAKAAMENGLASAIPSVKVGQHAMNDAAHNVLQGRGTLGGMVHAATTADELASKAADKLSAVERVKVGMTGDLHPMSAQDFRTVFDSISSPAGAEQVKGQMRAEVLHAAQRGEAIAKLEVTATDPAVKSALASLRQAEELRINTADAGLHAADLLAGGDANTIPKWRDTFAQVVGANQTQMLGLLPANMQIDSEMAKSLFHLGETIHDPGQIMRTIDQVTGMWKRAALLTPGFHVRNFEGGVFNNFAAQMDVSAYKDYLTARKAMNGGGAALEKLAPKDRAAIQTIFDNGANHLLGRTQAEVLQSDARRMPKGILGTGESQLRGHTIPTLTGKVAHPIKTLEGASAKFGANAEELYRGPLLFDGLRKGLTFDESLGRMYKYHFDYTDLTAGERNVARRVVPFWTWTSRNLPLMAGLLYQNPKLFAEYGFVKRNVEHNAGPMPSLVPGYFNDLGAIHTGGQNFLAPDLPLTRFEDMAGVLGTPSKLLQDVNPLAKSPIEMSVGKQFYTNMPLTDNLAPAPIWAKLPVLKDALEATGWLVKDKQGNLMISQKHAYVIDQWLPLLGRMRRLAPTEPSYQQRVDTSWLSFLGIRSLQDTKSAQNNVAYGNADKLKSMYKQLQEKGYTSTPSELKTYKASIKPQKMKMPKPIKAKVTF